MGSVAKKIKKSVRNRAGVEKTVKQMIQEQGRKNMAKEIHDADEEAVDKGILAETRNLFPSFRENEELHEGDKAAIDKEMAELGENIAVCTQQTLGPEAVLNGTEGGDDSAGNDNE